MKALIIVLLLCVLCALAGAGVFMLRKGGQGATSERDTSMARALALRVALSIAAFLLVLLAWALGWIKPTGIPMGG